MQDIYTKAPINKTAALVVSQANCTTELTDEQKRANLVARWKSITDKIISLPKKHPERKRLGKQQQEISLQINKIRAKRKGHHTLQHYIGEIVKERMTKSQWDKLMKEAIRRQSQAKGM